MASLPESSGYSLYEGDPMEYPTETFFVKDGCITGMECGLKAMEQAVSIALQTERYGYQIYSSNFGAELKGLIGKPEEYVSCMVKRRVEEALKIDNRIKCVHNFLFDSNSKGTIHCTFNVDTVYGSLQAEVDV